MSRLTNGRLFVFSRSTRSAIVPDGWFRMPDQAYMPVSRYTSTGSSLVILSKVKLITNTDCAAANAVAPVVIGNTCPNLNKTVFVEQLKVGNPSNGSSAFGTPPVQASGCTPLGPGTPCIYTVTIKDQGRTASALTNGFAMVLKAGELAYVAEMVNLTPDFNIPGLSGGPQVYTRAIF